MNTTDVISLIAAGIVVGFINTLAGGGSIISLSLLMFLGLPAPVANGTNRIAIFIQNIAATASFKQKHVLPWKKALWLSIPAIAGSLVGAVIAVDINQHTFEIAIGIIMIVMLFVVLFKPAKYIYGKKSISEKPIKWPVYIIFFFIGIYGGFIHMGVGYFWLTGIVLGAGFDLVKANAIKVVIILAYAPFTILVFLFNNQIHWSFGLILGAGSIIGALLASHMAVKKGVVFVKWVIIIVVLLTSIQMFGLFDIKGFFLHLLQKP